MMKTYLASDKDIKRAWHLIDARGKVLGRLAVKAASLLIGKHKPSFSRDRDTGDGVIVINASEVCVTGKKAEAKLYKYFSGYPGGLREVNFETLMKRKPTEALRRAVKGMLPKNTLGQRMLSRLKVYSKEAHPHEAQGPKETEI